jgi:anti-sigma regulatory factor (Ser/Thr protein kinase)
MKKLTYKYQCFLDRRNRGKMLSKSRMTKRIKHYAYMKTVDRLSNPDVYKAIEVRQTMLAQVYKRRPYDEKTLIISIEGEFGIEEKGICEYFFDKAEEIVNFRASSLIFNLMRCTRIWPSGVTLLCSLLHWTEMTAKLPHNPKISSSKPSSDNVNSFLSKCGFYDYVGRKKDKAHVEFDETKMVKLEQEKTKQGIKARRDQLKELIINQSGISDDHKELFIDVVLTEVILNVVEHGVGCNSTMGWWAIAQVHDTHGYISLCIADNGIGIRNSLVSGAQHEYIKERYKTSVFNDGESIKLAFEQSVSGAVNAPIKKKKRIGRDRYKRGAHRGNGLKRIKEACKEIGVSIAVLSHSGYLFIDSQGSYKKVGSRDEKVFAGTMYQFIIPVKGVKP